MRIKNNRAAQLARELSELTGESLTDAVVNSLERRLAEERRDRVGRRDVDDLVERFNQLPVLDNRSADETLGYDVRGLPN